MRPLLACIVVAVAFSCAPSGGGPEEPNGAVPALVLGNYVEIGAFDEPAEEVFGAIESVIRLGSGEIAVADGSSGRISRFSATGEFVTSFGGKGDGPGEFSDLGAIFPLGADSVIGAERMRPQLTAFSLDGTTAYTMDAREVSQDSLFFLDSWLHGRFWVHGAFGADERVRAKEVLDRLSPPRAYPGYRIARLGASGALWVREPASGEVHRWTKLTSSGEPAAVLDLPVEFRATHFLPGRFSACGAEMSTSSSLERGRTLKATRRPPQSG